MLKHVLFIFMLLLTKQVGAQEAEKLTGRVIDAKTKQPISAVHIEYQKSGVSTITNSEGEFLIAKADESDYLVFTHISYVSRKVSSQEVFFDIVMEESAVFLPEATVVSVPVDTIVKNVWDKYYAIYKANEKEKRNKKNHTFFYRQVTQTDTIYNEFIEGFFLGKSTYGVSDLELAKGRSASVKITEEEFALSLSNFFHQSCARPFHDKNPPPNKSIVNVFLQPNASELYNISLDRIMESNELGNIYVFTYIPKDTIAEKYIFTGKLFVRKTDLAILRFEAELFNMGINDNDIIKMVKVVNKIEADYKYYDLNYPIIESVKCFATIDLMHKNKMHKVKISSTLFLVEYDAGKSGKKLKQKTNLLETIMKSKFDADFWDNNPIIKRTALEDKIIEFFKNRNIIGAFQP